MSDQSTHEGHRARLRDRFLSDEVGSRSDESLLELLLTFSIPQRDVQPMAKTLLAHFGNLELVLTATPAELEEFKGIKGNSVVLLKLCDHLRKAVQDRQIEGALASNPPSEPAVQSTALSTVDPEVQETHPEKRSNERKLQVSNGYSLDTAQLARLLHCILDQSEARKIPSAQLIEGSGLSKRQVENLVSIGTALGLITPRTQILTPFGQLVVRHDIFLEHLTTLEFCHFLAAGNVRNLVWFEVFNDLLVTEKPMAQPAWTSWLRERLAGQYTPNSLTKHVAHEVRFIVDTYVVRNFKKLNLLSETPEKTYAVRRYATLQPLTLAAMIYAFGARRGGGVVPITDFIDQPGSPGRLFALDSSTLRQMVEVLHQREWLRYEVRHGLDQLRLSDGFEPLEFIAASYENRTPQAKPQPQLMPEKLLL